MGKLVKLITSAKKTVE